MKVSITFDKEVKESNKKQWVHQIQTVVNRLNSRNRQSAINITNRPQDIPKERPRIPSSDKKLYIREAEAIKKSSVSTEVPKKAVSFQKEEESQTGIILNELMKMQEQMGQKFNKIEKVLGNLTTKMGCIEKRVNKLEQQSQKQKQNEKAFECKFLEVVQKYAQIQNSSDKLISSTNSMSKYLAETNETNFLPPKPRSFKNTH